LPAIHRERRLIDVISCQLFLKTWVFDCQLASIIVLVANNTMALSKQFNHLLEDYWGFLDEGWPSMTPAKNHRTVSKQIGFIAHIKETLYKRLGAIPVYFFVTVIWPKHKYAGPYKEVEKGLVILFHLVKGLSMEAMEPHIPKSSFHAIHSMFYKAEYNAHNKYITNCLATMFSTINIRLLSAKQKNPPLFQHVTLHLDGHDTRATYKGESSADMYSYKLKKSGLRTQVAMDCNGMALFVSKSSPCKNFADGTMLLAMKIDTKIHELDCIAVDGGYPQFLRRLVEESDSLTLQNFAHPYRKKKNQDLTEEESLYNSTFGSFRSQMESLFGDLGATFEKHNNRTPVLVDKKQTYNLQLKLSLLLLNMKKMVAMLKIPEEPIHTAWCREGFEYPTTEKDVEQPMEYVDVSALVEDGNAMARLQEEFLGLELGDDDTTMETSAPNRKKCGIVIEIPVRKKKQHMDVDEDDDDHDL
jgi:DDE superfamily endonuclease